MSESGNWQASLLEQRMAWGIAAVCIMLVLLASARPEWFEFDLFAPPPKQVTKQAQTTPAKHVVTRQRQTHPATHARQPAKALKKAPAIHAKAKASPPTVAKHAAIADGFYVQLGAFKERPRAQGLADQLKRKGWATVIAIKADGLHAVWVGPEKTRGEAEKLRKAIQRKLRNKGFIVHKKRV